MQDYYDGKYAFFREPENEWKTKNQYRLYDPKETPHAVCVSGAIAGNPDEISRELYDVSDPIGPKKTVTRVENPSIEIDGYVRKITRKI